MPAFGNKRTWRGSLCQEFVLSERQHATPDLLTCTTLTNTPGASMTTYATRAPLQLIQNPHMMSDAQREGRRTSSRLAEKEDQIPNGIHHGYEPAKQSLKNVSNRKGAKPVGSGKTATKRKPGKQPLRAIATMERWSGTRCVLKAS